MASLESQLQQIKLKKVEKGEVKDFSDPKKAGFINQEEVSNYQRAVLDVNTENWMDFLTDLTFASKFCVLKFEEAVLFLSIYERNYKNLDPIQISEKSWQDTLSKSEMSAIEEIQKRLQSTMDSMFQRDKNGCTSDCSSQNDGVFVKLSCRSPKDAPLYQGKLKTLYTSELSNLPLENRKNDNAQIMCMLKACFSSMQVYEPSEVLDMHLRSERVYQDLLLATEHKDRYQQNFIVRQFIDIDIDMEFRGFVFEGSLTALCQYNYLIHSERLIQEKQKLLAIVQQFFTEDVAPRLQQAPSFPASFIMDFAICLDPTNQKLKVWVIEINPFLNTTDGALFSWEHERELLQGKLPFEFRITDRPRKGAKAMLPNSVKEILNSVN